jgi:hypothetical protein
MLALLCACSMHAGASSPLSDAARALGDIRSGTMRFRLNAQTPGGAATGFALEGTFDMSKAGELPRARLRYTTSGSARDIDATFVSDGKSASVQTGGRMIALPPAQAERLRSSDGAGPLRELRVDRWLVDPMTADGGSLDGVATTKTSASIDVVNMVNDLAALASKTGAAAQQITGKDADRLRRAVRRTAFEAWAGREDHYLRRLRMTVTLGVEGLGSLRRALGRYAGVTLAMSLDLEKPNQPVAAAAS